MCSLAVPSMQSTLVSVPSTRDSPLVSLNQPGGVITSGVATRFSPRLDGLLRHLRERRCHRFSLIGLRRGCGTAGARDRIFAASGSRLRETQRVPILRFSGPQFQREFHLRDRVSRLSGVDHLLGEKKSRVGEIRVELDHFGEHL